MSKIAEERAMEVYPIQMEYCPERDLNEDARAFFQEGYEAAEKDFADIAAVSSGLDGFYYGRGYQQGKKDAEKDLALTWRDIMVICEHYVDVNYEYDYHSIQEKYEEILRRFKEAKK